MIVVSFTDACSRLGIDAKTLHRWLHKAALPLHPHPLDGRKKELSYEQLEVLARLHHRHLPGTEPQVPISLPVLPADLLALPEQVAALYAEVLSLRASVADLTRLLTESKPPAQARPASHPTSTAKPKAQPTRPKVPAKPVHVIPRVEYHEDGHYAVICPKKGRLSFEPDTVEWFAWVKAQDSFRFVGKQGFFTAHHEWRVPKGAWRAHRKIRNRNHIQRLAPNHELTIAVLEQAAQALQAQLS